MRITQCLAPGPSRLKRTRSAPSSNPALKPRPAPGASCHLSGLSPQPSHPTTPALDIRLMPSHHHWPPHQPFQHSRCITIPYTHAQGLCMSPDAPAAHARRRPSNPAPNPALSHSRLLLRQAIGEPWSCQTVHSVTGAWPRHCFSPCPCKCSHPNSLPNHAWDCMHRPVALLLHGPQSHVMSCSTRSSKAYTGVCARLLSMCVRLRVRRRRSKLLPRPRPSHSPLPSLCLRSMPC